MTKPPISSSPTTFPVSSQAVFPVSGSRRSRPTGSRPISFRFSPTRSVPASRSRPGTILAHGFGGGGTFTLTTPQFNLGFDEAAVGTELPLDFFSATGFSAYNITSYKTDLIPNTFSNGLGGYNALLATQTVEIGQGHVLSLNQSFFSPILSASQVATLQNFATGGDLNTVMSPVIPTDAWDQRPISLTLGGLIDLKVDAGGLVTGAPAPHLTDARPDQRGDHPAPRGRPSPSRRCCPLLYLSTACGLPSAIGVHSLSDIFTTGADGSIDENAPNAMGLRDANNQILTNGQVAASIAIYLLGPLWNQGRGRAILAPGWASPTWPAKRSSVPAVPDGRRRPWTSSPACGH